MIYNAAELAALSSGIQNIALFFRLETDPIVRIWLGFGDIKPGINVLDTTGETYFGFGTITALPLWNQMLAGAAERISFTISGVHGKILEIASGGDAQQVKGKRVSVGFAVLDSNFALLGPVKWTATYRADFLTIAQDPTDDPSQPFVRSLSLSCGSIYTARWRPALAYFSDADEETRHPGNGFCERTPVYANGFNMDWPVFS